MSGEKWLTAEEVAAILQVHVDDVYRLINSGVIPGRKLGTRRWRVLPSDLADVGRVPPMQRRESAPTSAASPSVVPAAARRARARASARPRLRDILDGTGPNR